MSRLDDAKNMLLKTISVDAIKEMRSFSTEEERELVAYGELSASRTAGIKTKIQDLQIDRNQLRSDIAATTTMAELKTVWEAWINSEINPDLDKDKSRRRFRNTLGRGFEV